MIVGQLVKLRRIGNPPVGGAADRLRIGATVGRRIANPPQVANPVADLPHKKRPA